MYRIVYKNETFNFFRGLLTISVILISACSVVYDVVSSLFPFSSDLLIISSCSEIGKEITKVGC